jgi:hypothetical protein
MKKHKWTDDEINYVIDNYPIIDRYTCANNLNIPVEQLVYLVRKLGINKSKSIATEYFKQISEPIVAYILGFMWADGNISKDGRHFNVTGTQSDIEEIEWLFDKIGKWCKHFDNREKYGWKNAKTLIGSNPEIHNFLIEYDYDKKSYVSADKILSKIPDELKHYWFRGLIDGDGCFYINEKNYIRQFALTSTYEQDWSYFENLCRKLDIKYCIKRIKTVNKKTGKENKSSVVRIIGKEIIKLGEFIYFGEEFGLTRKLEKFKQIYKSYVNN